MVKLSTRTLPIRLAVLSWCLVLLAFGCADDGADTELTVDAAMSADMTAVSTDQEVAEPDTMVVTDVEVQTPDAQIPESDVGETTPDVAVTPVDMGTVENDAEVEVDAEVAPTVDAEVQTPDAELQADAGNSMAVLGCRLGDAWTVSVRSIPPEGMGCRQDGGPGQGDVTHMLVVDNPSGGPDSLTAYVVRPDQSVRPFSETGADSVSIEATFMENDGSCVLIGRASLGVNFPPDGSCGNRPTEVRMTYEYNLRATDGIVDGTGFVISEYGAFPITGNTDPATVEPCRAPCSEPLELNGSVEAP